MSDIQVGDVWKYRGGEDIKITAIGEKEVLFTYVDCGGAEEKKKLKNILKFYTLIERDGKEVKPVKPVKPERVFEDGYYWAKWGRKEDWEVAQCQYPDWYRIYGVDFHKTEDFHEIGEKIEEPGL